MKPYGNAGRTQLTTHQNLQQCAWHSLENVRFHGVKIFSGFSLFSNPSFVKNWLIPYLKTDFFPPTPGCMSVKLILIWRKPKELMAPNPHQRRLLLWSFPPNMSYLASHSQALRGNRFLGLQRFTGHRHCPFNELCHHAWSMPSNLSGRGRVTVALPRSSAACLHRKATAQVTACFASRWKAPLEMEVARAGTRQLILINQCLLIDGKSHLFYIQIL